MIILGITPARGGSKGIPRKNIRLIAGKPLIAWTIEVARKSKLLNDYVVSTENKEIAKIAKKYGAKVHNRPKELAGDNVITLPVLQDVLKKINADVVVLLQCTSPVRESRLIDKCIQQFLKTRADSLATGFRCHLYEWGRYGQCRQNLKGWFHDDGNVVVLKADRVNKAKSWDDVWGKKMERVEISKEQNFEIDNQFDFWLNEQILRNKKHEKL